MFAAVLAVLVASAVQASPPGPQRNLAVEMRIVDDEAPAPVGSVVLGRTGRAPPTADLWLHTRAPPSDLGAAQRVLVLNGAHATVRLARGVRVGDTEVAWTPWGPAAAVRSQWAELADGMEVAPRWSGGNAPVTLEIYAQRGLPGAQVDAAAPPAQWTLLSTVQLPLGEWVGVAHLLPRQAGGAGNGFDAATAARQRSLQVRVSLP